jgi:hypothetical protein
VIGYYVHHQGKGHLHRAVCVARHTRSPITGLSSLPRPDDWDGEWISLPLDAAPEAALPANVGDPDARGRLHWAPVHHAGLRERMGAIADWITRSAPSLLVSDVSVEVATLARLMGVPVVVAAMRGDRSDAAHLLAYDLADALLAPWPEQVPEPGWPRHWYEKTTHTGAFSRYDDRARPATPRGARAGRRRVLVMLGAGGNDLDAALLRDAARATPDWEWDVLGGPGATWCADPWPLLCTADVVVTHAGQNAIAECAAARRPAVVLPQERPHGEQHATAQALACAGLAVVRDRWPEPHEWPDVLENAARADGERWALWANGTGARNAARLLDCLAARAPRGEVACAQR